MDSLFGYVTEKESVRTFKQNMEIYTVLEEQLNELKIDCEKDDKIETVQLSRFIDGEIKVEMIIDNGPKFDSAGFSVEDREDEAGGMRNCGSTDDEGDFFN